MEYIVEIFFNGECIEQRRSKEPYWPLPDVGEEVHLSFDNPAYQNEHGPVWVVKERKYLWFHAASGVRTAQLLCEPKVKNTATTTDFFV